MHPQLALDRRITVDVAQVGIKTHDHVGGVLDQRGKVMLTPPQRLFRALALGDICYNSKDGALALIVYQSRGDDRLDPLAVFGDEGILVWLDVFTPHVLGKPGLYQVHVFWRSDGDKVEVRRVELLSRVAHDLFASLVGIQHSAAAVDKDHIRRLLSEHSELFLGFPQFSLDTLAQGSLRLPALNSILDGAPQQAAADLALDQIVLRTLPHRIERQSSIFAVAQYDDRCFWRLGTRLDEGIQSLAIWQREVEQEHVEPALGQSLQPARKPPGAREIERGGSRVGHCRIGQRLANGASVAGIVLDQ